MISLEGSLAWLTFYFWYRVTFSVQYFGLFHDHKWTFSSSELSSLQCCVESRSELLHLNQSYCSRKSCSCVLLPWCVRGRAKSPRTLALWGGGGLGGHGVGVAGRLADLGARGYILLPRPHIALQRVSRVQGQFQLSLINGAVMIFNFSPLAVIKFRNLCNYICLSPISSCCRTGGGI